MTVSFCWHKLCIKSFFRSSEKCMPGLKLQLYCVIPVCYFLHVSFFPFWAHIQLGIVSMVKTIWTSVKKKSIIGIIHRCDWTLCHAKSCVWQKRYKTFSLHLSIYDSKRKCFPSVETLIRCSCLHISVLFSYTCTVSCFLNLMETFTYILFHRSMPYSIKSLIKASTRSTRQVTTHRGWSFSIMFHSQLLTRVVVLQGKLVCHLYVTQDLFS